MFEGPGTVETTQNGLRIRFDSEDSLQTWTVNKDSLDIRSQTELDVRMQLRSSEVCPVMITSPWGIIETTAAVHGLVLAEDMAETVYELEGTRHHFLLEWTKE